MHWQSTGPVQGEAVSQHPGDLGKYPTTLTASEAWCWVAHVLDIAAHRRELDRSNGCATRDELVRSRFEQSVLEHNRSVTVALARRAPGYTRNVWKTAMEKWRKTP